MTRIYLGIGLFGALLFLIASISLNFLAGVFLSSCVIVLLLIFISNIRRLIFDYFSTVEKLFGTWKKAVLNLIMVAGFFLISIIFLVSFETVAYYINVHISQFNVFIFGSILAPPLSLIIIFQISSILLGLFLKYG
jgi:hypothetical protein